ncbi:MAG: MMPL family transporter, partial [Phycisphaerae bacterium]|nr:MMPL family transporter [Phycisphaerae bacterium]
MTHLADLVARFATGHRGLVTVGMIAFTIIVGALAAAPSLWQPTADHLHTVTIDTDPENMLGEDEPVRVFHDHMKEQFRLYDMIVVGVVDQRDPNGVFNVDTLGRIYELTQYAKTLRGETIDAEPNAGVVSVDLIAPSTVDHVESQGLGTVTFEWLMPSPPQTAAQAIAVRDKAQDIPFLDGTLVSEDGQALALYLPITRKDLAHSISTKLQKKIGALGGAEDYHITGLPVAEDTFGVAMFKQMAISAPTAGLVIFILMWVFFRKLSLIIAPMIMAALTAAQTMSLLVISGQTIHIMSSMIPIFIMPIAVLDAIHIISDFFDRYPRTRDRRQTAIDVLHHLFEPMLFTSLTTAAGFASLALTPIPPVQVFGIFVAIGVLLAWLWTITFIPAAIMFIPEKRLASLAAAVGRDESATQVNGALLSRVLQAVGRLTVRRAPVVLALAIAVIAVSLYGISLIRINDNPTKWFESDHPIRVADRVLNDHFGGTYMAYLELEPNGPGITLAETRDSLRSALDAELDQPWSEPERAAFKQFRERLESRTDDARRARLADLGAWADEKLDNAPDDRWAAWDAISLIIESEAQRDQIFKQPEALRWIEDLQKHLRTITDDNGEHLVGKSNSLADIVKTVHRELLGGDPNQLRVPDKPRTVAETLIQYQNSHRPQDLDKFVTRNSSDASVHFRRSNLWLQLQSGDNRDMEAVTVAVDSWISNHPPPFDLQAEWFGLTYINVVWQDKMVSGMLYAFLGSFLVVLLMMIALFRSALWGLLSMIPLLVTVGFIYGLIGLIGKDYDMPVAVLSSLSLGLAIDYAIHFLARGRRAVLQRYGNWPDAAPYVFGEPARAITRNAIVVGVGFAPLLLAPLTPYKTVGLFIALILLTAGAATLLILPALMRLLEPLLFPGTRAVRISCHCF